MIQSFFLPCTPRSWNKIATAHWRTYKAIKDEQANLMLAVLPKLKKFPPGSKLRLTVSAYWSTKNKRFDLDNLFIKAVNDMLVKRGIIEDDNVNIIQEIIYRGFPNYPLGGNEKSRLEFLYESI